MTLGAYGDTAATEFDYLHTRRNVIRYNDVANVCRVVADAAGLTEPFDFQVRGIQAVPARGNLSMFWAGVADPEGRMAAMFEVFEAALEELGFPREQREFHPHVTLGRVKYARDGRALRAAAARQAEADFGCVAADEIVVYSSQLTPDGPVYAPMGRGEFAPQEREQARFAGTVATEDGEAAARCEIEVQVETDLVQADADGKIAGA